MWKYPTIPQIWHPQTTPVPQYDKITDSNMISPKRGCNCKNEYLQWCRNESSVTYLPPLWLVEILKWWRGIKVVGGKSEKSHFHNILVRQFLDHQFVKRGISRFNTIHLIDHLHSIVLNIFLWGSLKQRDYSIDQLHTREVKKKIRKNNEWTEWFAHHS